MRAKLVVIGILAAGLIALADSTPPTSQASSDPAPNAYGWNNSPVTVTITAQDEPGGSGVREIRYRVSGGPVQVVPGATAEFILSSEGKHVVEYWAVDNAGNEETPHTMNVWIDLTPPRAVIRVPADGAKYMLNQMVTVDWFAFDRLSGIASLDAPAKPGEALDTERVGFHTFQIWAVDYAGNEIFLEAEYQVIYAITATGYRGFFLDRLLPADEVKKVGILPVLARYELGETIRISFKLFDVNGKPVTSGYPTLLVTEVKFDEEGGEKHTIWAWKRIPYSAENGEYLISYPTSERKPGIYDLWIDFGDGQHERIRIELIPKS